VWVWVWHALLGTNVSINQTKEPMCHIHLILHHVFKMLYRCKIVGEDEPAQGRTCIRVCDYRCVTLQNVRSECKVKCAAVNAKYNTLQ